jgi:hypothetical protein
MIEMDKIPAGQWIPAFAGMTSLWNQYTIKKCPGGAFFIQDLLLW